jgi:ABC-type dipeptide/oligopeptide/nickel transport system permease component
MLTFTIRRLLLAIPTLVLISLIIFLLLDLAPGDPLADQPLSIPPEVRQKMRDALGLDSPAYVRYLLWAKQFFWVEPLVFVDWVAGTSFSEGMQRIVSWQFRAPVFDIIIQRLPQTLWVVGLAYVVGALIALPIGIISAYKQYSWFDQIGTFISMIGFSVPTILLRRSDDRVFRDHAALVARRSTTPRSRSTTSRVSASRSSQMTIAGYGARAADNGATDPASCAPRCSTTSVMTMCAQRAPRA